MVLLPAAATDSTFAGKVGDRQKRFAVRRVPDAERLVVRPRDNLASILRRAPVALTAPVWPASVRTTFPLFTSKTLIDLSADAVKTCAPPGFTATLRIGPACPAKIRSAAGLPDSNDLVRAGRDDRSCCRPAWPPRQSPPCARSSARALARQTPRIGLTGQPSPWRPDCCHPTRIPTRPAPACPESVASDLPIGHVPHPRRLII